MSQLAPLDLNRLRRQLAAAPIGHALDYHRTLPSTMPVAVEQIRQSAARPGLVVVAEEQTAGRGRQARRWQAPAGLGLLVSIGLKPPLLRLPPTHLPMAAGLATLDALAALAPSLAPQLTLKWPNDLLLGPMPDQAGKVAGILIETGFTHAGALDYAVVGIGVNANQTAGDLPAVRPPAPPPTSLRLALGKAVDRTGLLVHLCRALAVRLDTPPESLLAAWRARLGTLGRRVAVYPQGGEAAPTLTGLAVDVDAHGSLMVQDDAGRLHSVVAGDVSLRLAG